MNPETNVKQEQDDLKLRPVLQAKLQEAIRRSAPASEVRKIEEQIVQLNLRLESYAVRVKKP